jgi:hypothetical protein
MRSLATLAVAAAVVASPAVASAATPCPPEVKEARALLTAKTTTGAKATQPPKSQAAARGQDTQAPRGQDQQAPRGQDQQAPRSQDQQAPRGQDQQAPRGQDQQAPRNVAKGRTAALANARKLVNEAEMACKDADGQRASANARAAMELLNYIP